MRASEEKVVDACVLGSVDFEFTLAEKISVPGYS